MGPNGTGKLVVEVVSSQVVLLDTVYYTVFQKYRVKLAIC